MVENRVPDIRASEIQAPVEVHVVEKSAPEIQALHVAEKSAPVALPTLAVEKEETPSES